MRTIINYIGRVLCLCIPLALVGCGPDFETVHVCSCEQMKSVEAFVSNNVEAANNRSDEEMEDVISELFKAGVRSNCPQKRVAYEGMSALDLGECETAYRYFY